MDWLFLVEKAFGYLADGDCVHDGSDDAGMPGATVYLVITLGRLLSTLLLPFPPNIINVEGLLFSWPLPCLSSLLDFLFLDLHFENGGCFKKTNTRQFKVQDISLASNM